MSDQSQGEGWWQASDGKWYPPPRPDVPAGGGPAEPVSPVQPVEPTQPLGTPAGPPPGAPPFAPPPGSPSGPPTQAFGPPSGPPPGAPPKSGLGKGPLIAIAIAAVVIIAAVVFFATRDSGSKDNASATKSEQTDTSSDSTDSSTSKSSSSKSSSSSSGTVTVPAGFKVISNNSEGVSIAVPNEFVEIDPANFVNNASQSDFSSLNPELAPFLSSGNAFLSGSVLAATGTSSAGPSFVVVAKSPQSFDPTDPQFASELENQLGTAGATNVTTDTVTLPAGDALRVGVSLDINTSANSGTVNETLYFVSVGRTTWGLIGASVGSAASADLFDQIAKTFTVKA